MASGDKKEASETTEQSPPPSQPYTVFTTGQRRYLTYFLGYLTLASSLTATIYFPLISLLSTRYSVSVQAINLSITLYVVFQAIAPAFWAPISDTFGRRPIFLATFIIYCAASLGLALNRTSYVALLLLRALQSIGGSAVMSLAYGVAADISQHSERGKILGPMLASTNLGPCIGPVIGGGAILAAGDPQWCFWALLIFGASSLLLIACTMRETARTVVGNGAVRAHGVWRTGLDVAGTSAWFGMFVKRTLKLFGKDYDVGSLDEGIQHSSLPVGGDINAGKTGRGKMTVPNPFATIRMIFYRDTFLILWMSASSYAAWYCIQTSIPLIYGKEYGYNDLIVGLCYLPGGVGVILGGLLAGRLMDRNYNRTAKETGWPVETSQTDDTSQFPFERARSRGSSFMLVFSICALAGYGWVVQRHVHISVALILQFLVGAKCTVTLQMFSALLVDIFPNKAGAAGAANNITRSALSAAAVAVLQPLVDAIGRGWFFTLIGLIDGVFGIIVVQLLKRWGQSWRQKRECP